MRRILVKAVAHANRTGRRGLTREAIVARALEIGSAEGLEAVSLRRLASDLGVTPMALYRHVRDKQDLVNAMTEVVLEGFDLTAGFEPSMSWADRLRRALENFRDQMEARPLALPLAISSSCARAGRTAWSDSTPRGSTSSAGGSSSYPSACPGTASRTAWPAPGRWPRSGWPTPTSGGGTRST